MTPVFEAATTTTSTEPQRGHTSLIGCSLKTVRTPCTPGNRARPSPRAVGCWSGRPLPAREPLRDGSRPGGSSDRLCFWQGSDSSGVLPVVEGESITPVLPFPTSPDFVGDSHLQTSSHESDKEELQEGHAALRPRAISTASARPFRITRIHSAVCGLTCASAVGTPGVDAGMRRHSWLVAGE